MHHEKEPIESKKAGDDEETCDIRKKSSLISDEEWKKCHSKAQKKAQINKQMMKNVTKLSNSTNN